MFYSLLVAVARPTSDGVAHCDSLHYALPVFWMTSYFLLRLGEIRQVADQLDVKQLNVHCVVEFTGMQHQGLSLLSTIVLRV